MWLSGRTLRSGLLLVVLATLLPMVALSVVQGRVAWRDAQTLTVGQLRATAWMIAESERDAFVIARQAVLTVSSTRAVRLMTAGCSEALVSAHNGTIGIINLTRSDATGRVRCSALPFSPTESFAGDDWWKRAVLIRGLSISAPIIGRISKKPILVVALPVATADGIPDGVLTASISLEALRASLQRRTSADPEALINIVDGQGAIILTNRKVPLTISQSMIKSQTASVARTPDGAEWLFAVAPLQGENLSIIYAKPRADLLQAASWQVRQTILLPMLALALASIAIWIGTHWLVVRWLQKLQGLAGQFASGDFSGNRSSFERAPREIAALSDDLHVMAETIDARDTALLAAIDEKTALTREVNHRVKNNLQIVSSLLTLQGDRLDDEQARLALNQAKVRIAALGAIHRVIYEQESLGTASTVNMRAIMAELCPQLRTANRAYSDLDLNCTCDDIALSTDRAVPLTLFIVEAVTNAYRHGYIHGGAGIIEIGVTSIGDQIALTVTDDGVGYDATDAIGKMGFELMNAFAAQLGGTLNATSSATGTMILLTFPQRQY